MEDEMSDKLIPAAQYVRRSTEHQESQLFFVVLLLGPCFICKKYWVTQRWRLRANANLVTADLQAVHEKVSLLAH